jgi:hypothetical protein
MHAARQRFTSVLAATKKLQAFARGLAARRAYKALQHGVVIAQALWRGQVARRQLAEAKVCLHAC